MSYESEKFEFEREADFGREAGLIEKDLAESCLDRKKAAEVAGEIYGAALEINGLIGRLLLDPEFFEKYSYDGMFIKDKNSVAFHVVPDGARLFKIMTEGDMLRRYFEANDWPIAINGLREHLDKYRAQARSLLLHWEANKTIPSSINEEAKKRIEKDFVEMRRNAGGEPPLTEPEETFFREYEREMEEFLRDEGKKENGDPK